MKLVFIGPPGSGKGTLSKTLVEKLGIRHISTGDIIRNNIKQQTSLGLEAKDVLEQGELVSDGLMKKLVESTLRSEENLEKGYILDGFPRTVAQTEWFLNTFAVDRYVFFKISTDTVIERISGRRIHPASNRIYHVTYAPPKQEGKDDITGDALEQREDDNAEKVLVRLEVYKAQTFPIIALIQNSVEHWCTIDAEQPEEEMLQSAMELLGL